MVLYQIRLDILFEIFQFSCVKYILLCYMLIWQKHVNVDAFFSQKHMKIHANYEIAFKSILYWIWKC